MTVRVVARIRPSQPHELSKDIIVSPASTSPSAPSTLIKIPNPKNASEDFTFAFSGVYGPEATQQEVFDAEIAPTIKHLFGGFDVTIFAYGVTGTGKTHTMRGGKTLAERGVIPRLLSGIYRKSRKMQKDSKGEAVVELTLSYYEIYNDKVFDLLEAPEKRTSAGLPLRDSGGKTMVVGLAERPCESLKEFEKLYDEANVNRSTSATKLNAHSSRSHAVLRINIAVTTGNEIRISTASAIDLAGSEDNRRTENGKERLVESASINKSLFVLAKCVEAISNKQRAPYRESKMTRILSLGRGQNNGMTIMILNLAPVKSFHLDTLSSLNFANRTKKIEVREVENEPVFKGCPRAVPSFSGPSIQRQPLRPLASTVHNAIVHAANTSKHGDKPGEKPTKAFFVYSDRARLSNSSIRPRRSELPKRATPVKRSSDALPATALRPAKRRSPVRPNQIARPQDALSKEALDEIIERKVTHILAARALDQPSIAPQPEISEQVQKRLELLEQKIEGKDDGREQGLTFLLMAKQHAVRGEDMSALRMYTLAKEYFPENAKLDTKIQRLRGKFNDKKRQQQTSKPLPCKSETLQPPTSPRTIIKVSQSISEDDGYRDPPEPVSDIGYESAGSFRYRPKTKKKPKAQPAKTSLRVFNDPSDFTSAPTPRTKQLLDIVNGRDMAQIRLLKGVGAKKAEAILEALCAGEEDEDELQERKVYSLSELGRLKGVGAKTVENMRAGLGDLSTR